MPDPSQQPHLAPDRRPSDELVLAAIARAILHDPLARGAATVPTICEHLGAAPRSRAARHIRARLAVQHAAGWLECSRRHGAATWAPTAAGRRYLARVRRAGRLPDLPESPQHRLWRDAQRRAGAERARFAGSLLGLLEQAVQRLDAGPPAHSDEWFALGEELERACRLVGSASHCLREWPEPRDTRADIDHCDGPDDERLDPPARDRARARRRGRRNVRLWEPPAGGGG